MTPFNNFHNEQILKLDVKQQQPNKVPRFVQYDSALLKIELYDDGKLYDVSRADDFVVSVKRPDGSTVSGLAEYDGEFINYKLSKQDLDILGESSARLQIYEGRNRISSLSFRYDVYEDYETVGDPDDVTLLSALLAQVRDALLEAQRQGGYAENRGDFANVAGDYANSAGDSQKMRWLKWVKTVADRNKQYPNPRNGDTVYVVNVSDKNGGAVYRYNGVNRPFKWEEIAGWDTSIIQDIYNLIATKEDKTKVAEIVEELQKDLEDTIFGGRNIVPQTDTSIEEYDKMYRPVTSSSEVQMINTGDVAGRVVQARLAGDNPQSYFGATVGNSSGDRFSVKEGEELVLSFKGTTSLTATDFTYVYLMRPSGEGSNRKMDLQFVRDVDHTGYDKYEFTVTSPWTSDNAYLLIGSNKKSEYEDAGHPFWIRFKDVQLERGNRATDWKPAIEDIITNFQNKISELEEENDGKFRQHDSRIKVLEDEIKFTITETVYDDNMTAIEEWQSEYSQTARQIQTTLSKKVGNDEIISRINQTAEEITIDANKISLIGNVEFKAVSDKANLGDTAYNRTQGYASGTRGIHPNTMSDWGMTSISGGRIQTDRMIAQGIDIVRPDSYRSGGKDYGIYMQDGIINVDADVQRNQFMHGGGFVSFTGQRYQLNGSGMSHNSTYNMETIYTSHKGKYITVGFGMSVSGTAAARVIVELAEFTSGNGYGRHMAYVREGDGTVWNSITVDLGVPDYTSNKSFYVRAGLEEAWSSSYLQVVINRVTIHG